MSASIDRSVLADHLRRWAFPVPGACSARLGAEVELIPVDEESGRPLPLDGGGRSALTLVRRAGAMRGWCERRSAKAGVPEVHLPTGARITFEPGGQVEVSSAPYCSASELLAELRAVTTALEAEAAREGVTLLSVGIDPRTPVHEVRPQLDAVRYQRMLSYLDGIGPWGARMMRQTASVQVSVDGGVQPLRTWRVLNAMAPYLAAIFANSPVYEDQPTGHQSFRHRVWRGLDPSRTGIRSCDGDAVDEYLGFALDAPAFLAGDPRDSSEPFEALVARGAASLHDWQTHLTTLFPEVRPRGYFEVRSPDAIAPRWYVAPIALVAGICQHDPSLNAAADLLGPPDEARLVRAGMCGLRDPAIARVANDLVTLALVSCETLGDRFLTGADREAARDFFDRYTRRCRSPADDVLDAWSSRAPLAAGARSAG